MIAPAPYISSKPRESESAPQESERKNGTLAQLGGEIPQCQLHKDHGETESRRKPQRPPRPQVDPQAMQQRRHRSDRSHCGKYADMARALNHLGSPPAAVSESQEIESANKAYGQRREILERGPNRNQDPLQTLTREQDSDTQQQ